VGRGSSAIGVDQASRKKRRQSGSNGMKSRLVCLVIFSYCSMAIAQPAPQQQWGTILGRVVYDGKPPVLENLVVNNDVIPGKEPKVPDESHVVGQNGGLANVFVFLRSKPSVIHPGYTNSEPKKILFEAKDYRFVPHALCIWTHDIFEYRNREPYGMNLNYSTPKQGISVLLPPKESYQRSFLITSNLPHIFSCNMHPWYNANFLVRDNPYFCVTNERGIFCIPNLPANEELEFQFWHERIGFLKNIKSDVETVSTNDKGRLQTKLTQPVTDFGEFRIDPKLFEVSR
jgi:hypothetical protein